MKVTFDLPDAIAQALRPDIQRLIDRESALAAERQRLAAVQQDIEDMEEQAQALLAEAEAIRKGI